MISPLPRTSYKTLISPLRYPGSKRRFAKYIGEVIDRNSLHPNLFVEVFAGGASVSLQLLNNDVVEKIGLIEIDPLVAAFWNIVFSNSDVDWLIGQIETIEITLEQWRIFKHTMPGSQRMRALACLYLNRTSFSGILAPSSGPLGGYRQESDYPIDCRFPRKTLIQRIQEANALSHRVAFVKEADWALGLKWIEQQQKEGALPQEVFFYFDPPFFEKADKLYNFYFTKADHVKLRNFILQLEHPWVLSYDYCEQVEELYADHVHTHIEMLYSAAQNGGQRAVKEVILTKLLELPVNKKLWQAADENKNGCSSTKNSTYHR